MPRTSKNTEWPYVFLGYGLAGGRRTLRVTILNAFTPISSVPRITDITYTMFPKLGRIFSSFILVLGPGSQMVRARRLSMSGARVKKWGAFHVSTYVPVQTKA